MKIKWVLKLWLFACLFQISTGKAQTVNSYSLPAGFLFDYEVVQKISGNKNPADSCTVHFLYTKNGDYAAARMTGKAGKNGNLLLVTTRDGILILFDERRKDITMISMRKLMSDLGGMMKYIRMDSLMAHMQKNKAGKEFESVKTGRSKAVGNYISEEYTFTDHRGQKGSVWLAKADFNGPADYMLSALGGNLQQMMTMMGSRSGSHPLMQSLMQPRTLVTEIAVSDSTGNKSMQLHTVGINPVSTTVSIAGYQVSDYSNLTMAEIFQEEMKKRNNN